MVLEDGNYTAEEKKAFMEIVDIKYIFGQMKSMQGILSFIVKS